MEFETFYDILEVAESATQDEIKAAFRRLANEYHPDRVPEHLTKLRKDAEEKFKSVNEAHNVLSSAVKRVQYDAQLANLRGQESTSVPDPEPPPAQAPPKNAQAPPPQTGGTGNRPSGAAFSGSPPASGPVPVPAVPSGRRKAWPWVVVAVLAIVGVYFATQSDDSHRNTPASDLTRQILFPAGLSVRWQGSVGTLKATLLTFLSEGSSLPSGTLINKDVEEQFRVEIQDDGSVILKGLIFRKRIGKQPYYLDTFVGKLSDDGATLQGTYSDAVGNRGPWQFRRGAVFSEHSATLKSRNTALVPQTAQHGEVPIGTLSVDSGQEISPTPSAAVPGQSASSGPVLTSITPILPQASQTITINGYGFGNQDAYDGNSPYIMLTDITRNWNAGSTNGSDLVTLRVARWTNTEITIDGFTGAYGGAWTLGPGDKIRIQIWNPQSGAGPATGNVIVAEQEDQ